jgi:tripartite-type tricarboxylate transporter receptor subunit TctC
MKKTLAISLSVLMAASLLTGCSGSSNGTAAETTKAAETTAKAESSAATASSDYPKGPITVVVPYGAGGGTDLFCRVVADKMSQSLGVPFEVTNLTGGGGTIGATDVMNAPADGYKLGFCISAPLAVMPLYGETSYQLEDCQPICGAYSTLNVLAVAADSPIQNVDDLIKYIEDNNGSLSYGGS